MFWEGEEVEIKNERSLELLLVYITHIFQYPKQMGKGKCYLLMEQRPESGTDALLILRPSPS